MTILLNSISSKTFIIIFTATESLDNTVVTKSSSVTTNENLTESTNFVDKTTNRNSLTTSTTPVSITISTKNFTPYSSSSITEETTYLPTSTRSENDSNESPDSKYERRKI